MSITVRPSETFTTDLTGAPQGASVTLGIRELPSGTMVSAFSSTGIVEAAQGNGTSIYSGTRTAPAVPSVLATAGGPRYAVVWIAGGVEQSPEDLWVSAPYGVPLAAFENGAVANKSGRPVAGAEVRAYRHGTTTPVQVYADEAMAIPLAQPLITTAAGAVPGYVSDGQAIDVRATYRGITYPAAVIET